MAEKSLFSPSFWSRLALLFWWQISSVSSFGVDPVWGSRTKSHFKSGEMAALTSPQDLETSSVVEGDGRNMFHNYDKPLVLVGCSGKSNELMRLAESLQPENILSIANQGSDSEVALVETLSLIDNIDNKRFSFPDVIVIDFNDPLFSVEDGKYADELERHFADTLSALYDHDMLNVLVSVDPTVGGLTEESKARLARQEQHLVDKSDFELCIRDEGSDTEGWEHTEWELTRLLARARLIPAVPGDKTRTSNTAHLTMGENTFFLSLSFPDIRQVEPYIEEMCQDVDAMEYRADLLDCRDSRFELLYGMQLLRRYCRPHTQRVPALPFSGQVLEDVMPILFTVRTQNQAGTYPDDEAGIAKMFDLLKWGLRGGVEGMDVESAWDKQMTSKHLDRAEKRYSTQILGSHHVVGETVSMEEAVQIYDNCRLDGRAHGAKVVLSATDESMDRMAYEASLIATELSASKGEPLIPKISLVLDDVGVFSRILNLNFTPVTHGSLPFKAAPGQLSSSEIMTTRLLTKIFQPKKYAILGHKIDYSVSPQMHGAAFAATQLPHEYLRVDVETVEEFVESDLFKSDDFGGTSVTIPHKQAIIPYVDVLSEAAKAIGSVNTVIARQEYSEEGFKRVIYGENTDWRGIFNPLNRLLAGNIRPDGYVLILGAGGTARAAAYVAGKLGLNAVYYNRTPEKANELASTFGGTVATSLDEAASEEDSLQNIIGENGLVQAVISTLPAAANFELPDWLLDDEDHLPIVFDVNYKPFNTKLLLQAEAAKCSVVRGSEMLWEQGVGQFEHWVCRTAPYKVMKAVVLKNCEE